jgi:hypothetical protein
MRCQPRSMFVENGVLSKFSSRMASDQRNLPKIRLCRLGELIRCGSTLNWIGASGAGPSRTQTGWCRTSRARRLIPVFQPSNGHQPQLTENATLQAVHAKAILQRLRMRKCVFLTAPSNHVSDKTLHVDVESFPVCRDAAMVSYRGLNCMPSRTTN